jgi:hypothetical protein
MAKKRKYSRSAGKDVKTKWIVTSVEKREAVPASRAREWPVAAINVPSRSKSRRGVDTLRRRLLTQLRHSQASHVE